MTGSTKLMTAGGGGVSLTPASSIASDVTVKVPAVNGDVVLTNVAGTVALNATGANIITASTNGSERMRIDSSGNVGIGTSSPNARLEVATASGASDIRLSVAGTLYGNIYASSSDLTINSTTAIPLIFGTNNTERMRIDSSGNLLVGTTSSPGSSGIGSGFIAEDQGRRVLQLATNTTASRTLAAFINPNGAVGSIATSGTTTAYNTSSDYRLKENIQPMQNALATVAQLNPVTYNWKADGSDGQGFIAHELQAVVPDCVTGEKDAVDSDGNPVYQGIDTSFLVATLTKAIQEQQAQIETLTAKVAALEAK